MLLSQHCLYLRFFAKLVSFVFISLTDDNPGYVHVLLHSQMCKETGISRSIRNYCFIIRKLRAYLKLLRFSHQLVQNSLGFSSLCISIIPGIDFHLGLCHPFQWKLCNNVTDVPEVRLFWSLCEDRQKKLETEGTNDQVEVTLVQYCRYQVREIFLQSTSGNCHVS